MVVTYKPLDFYFRNWHENHENTEASGLKE
jgi:hypothetical protein